MGFEQWKRKEQRSQRSQRKDGGRSRRPPPSPGISFDSVPKWERRFCSQISWRDFCDSRQAMHLYSTVLDWDDSAGKEAFDNAKARYWAEINGLPCDIPLPDPDMYIDEIDYDAPIDSWLIEDLYKMPPPPPPPCEEIPDIKSIIPTGWDVVDPPPSGNIPEYIFAISSSPNDILDNSAPNHQVVIDTEASKVVPPGWSDEADTEINNAKYLQERESNGALSTNGGSSENQYKGWQQDRRNDDMIASEKVSLLEHRDDTYWRESGGGDSFGSTYMYQRCNEQGYEMDIWKKYTKEQFFWHQPSLNRGLSCAPRNY